MSEEEKKTTPAGETPEENVSKEATPEEQAPVEEAATEQPAAEETPVEEPSTEAVAEEAPAEKVVAEEAPAEEAPAEEAVVEEAPAVAEKVAEEAPAEEKPAEVVAEEPVPEIKIPTVKETASSDIVASKPDAKERQSAVIGSVDRPMATKQTHRRGGFGGNRRGGRRFGQAPVKEDDGDGLFEKVVHINRCAKVVAGGRRFSFSALVVVGDQKGNVGVGYGKAKEVPECIRKGTEKAKKSMAPIAMRNNTIPHEVLGQHDGGRILLRPAVPGTGVIAGGGVRAVLEAAGVKDVLTKSMRSNNPSAMVFATLDALQQLRSLETIQKLRKA